MDPCSASATTQSFRIFYSIYTSSMPWRSRFLNAILLLLFLVTGLLVRTTAESTAVQSDGPELYSSGHFVAPGKEKEDDEEEGYDDVFLRKYTLDIDEETDCRDATDSVVNCTYAKAKGLCDPAKSDENISLHVPVACRVSCGNCPKPLTKTDVWVDLECVEHMEDIRVYFTNTNPEPDDFLAIYPDYIDFTRSIQNVDEMELWLYACGNVHETCRSASGGLIFGKRGISPKKYWYYFPLHPGKYKAALMRHNGTFIAESEPFIAKAEGHSCSWHCHDAVFTDYPCYEAHDMVHVTFENCAARNDDRIAIFEASDSSSEDPLLWLDACFGDECMGTAQSDVVSFGSTKPEHLLQGRETWPLPAGDYVAALLRSTDNRNWRRVASSTVFEVVGDGYFCSEDGEDDHGGEL